MCRQHRGLGPLATTGKDLPLHQLAVCPSLSHEAGMRAALNDLP
jgi:hypothetical protein